MSTYLGYDFLDIRPPRLLGSAEAEENFSAIVESKAGTFGVQWMSHAHPWTRIFQWFCPTRQDIQNARDFLARRQGMYSPFWVPTWAADFLLTANSSIDASSFQVTSSGRSATDTNVAVITPTAIYPRTISTYVTNTLTLTSSIPVALNVDTTLISYLALVRLTTDEVIMSFQALDIAELTLNYVEIV